MNLAIRRPWLIGVCGLLLLAQVGCAARPGAVPPRAPDGHRMVPANAETSDCEAFARAEAAALQRPSAVGAFAETFGMGLIAGAGAVVTAGFCVPCIFAAPVMILGAPFHGASVARDNQRARDVMRAAALERCQKPILLEAELGPDHPDLARSLQDLAVRYSALGRRDQAEALHRRALGIRERALPAGHPDIADSLEAVTALLRQSSRVEDAEAMENRARVIRGDEEGQARATGRLPQFARTLFEQGSAEASGGDPVRAEQHYRRALAIQQSEPAVDPEDLRRTLASYAALLRGAERAAEATEIEALGRALPTREASRPSTMPTDAGQPAESAE